MKILLVEDDIQLKNSISRFLILKGFDVTAVESGDEALDLIDTQMYDVFIFDINLPHFSGLELLSHIRAIKLDAPVVLVTASLEITPLEKAYELKCTEYMKKPFDLRELELRLNKIISKSRKVFLSNNIVYDLETEILYIDEVKTYFRPKELLLIRLLVKHINQVVQKEKIIDIVWAGEEKEAYPLRQLMVDIRKKIPSTAIISHHSIGYELKGKLE